MLTVEQGQLDIFQRRSAREQIETLKNEAELPIANVGQLVAVEARNIDAIEQVAAARRAIEAAEHIHQRGFSRAARAHEGDKLAPRNFQRNAAHGVHVHLAGAVGLVHVLQPNDSGVSGHIDSAKIGAAHRPKDCSIVAPRMPSCPSSR